MGAEEGDAGADLGEGGACDGGGLAEAAEIWVDERERS